MGVHNWTPITPMIEIREADKGKNASGFKSFMLMFEKTELFTFLTVNLPHILPSYTNYLQVYISVFVYFQSFIAVYMKQLTKILNLICK